MLQLVLSLLAVFHPFCTVSQKRTSRLRSHYSRELQVIGYWDTLNKTSLHGFGSSGCRRANSWRWMETGNQNHRDGSWDSFDLVTSLLTGVSSEHHSNKYLLLWGIGVHLKWGLSRLGRVALALLVHCALVTITAGRNRHSQNCRPLPSKEGASSPSGRLELTWSKREEPQRRHEGLGTIHSAVTARLENLQRETQPPRFVFFCVFKLRQCRSHSWGWRPHKVLMSWELDFC